MSIKFIDQYFNDHRAKNAFEVYAMKIFGLDFSLWKERGLWDNDYIAFSAFDGGECIASICVYPSEITFKGKVEKWAQLLTVGTLPEYRLKGLQRELWDRAYSWIRKNCRKTFLLTDDSAAGFYEKLGFTRKQERYDVIKLKTSFGSGLSGFRRLNLNHDADFEILKRLAISREPVSDILGVKNPKLMLFIFLYVFQDWCYYSKQLDTVVVIEELNDRLRIHDIAAEKMPVFLDIENFAGQFGKEEIDILFCTDKLQLKKTIRKEIADSILFMVDDSGMDFDFMFPSSIRT